MSNQQPLLIQSPQKTDIPLSFWNKYKNYIVLGSISVIVFGIIGYFIYKKFKKSGGEKVDCQLSDWMYTDCICDSGNLNGYVYRTQTIIKEAENGGIACPSPDQLKQVVRQCSCSTPHLTTPHPSPHLTTPYPSPHLTTPQPSPHLTTPYPSPHLTTPQPSPHLTTPQPSPHLTTPQPSPNRESCCKENCETYPFNFIPNCQEICMTNKDFNSGFCWNQ